MSTATPLAYSQLPMVRPQRGAVARTLIWLMQTAAWIALGALIVGGTGYAVASTTSFLIGVFIPIGVLLLLISGAILARGIRRVRDLSVLHYLEHAVRLDAPLISMIAAAEQSERGGVQSRLRRLRMRLQDGDPLAAALSSAAPALPPRMIGLVAARENTGRLAASLRRILGRHGLFPASNPTHSIFYRWYPLVLFAFCFAVMQMVLIFVTPKFEQILRDFKLPVHPAMRWAEQIADNFSAIALIASVAMLLVFCGRMASMLFTARGVSLGPLRRPFERMAWITPIAGIVIQSRALADACQVIAEAVDAGFDAHRAIGEAASAAPNSVMARRLKHWAAGLQAGSDLSTPARAARLPKLLCAMLATSDGPGDLPDIFRFLCRYYDGRFSRVLTLLRALIPGIALAFGVVVAAIALNVFQPLIDLINKLLPR